MIELACLCSVFSVNGHGNNREEQCTHNPNMWLYRKMEVGPWSRPTAKLNTIFAGSNKENAGPPQGRSNKDCKHFYVQNTLRIFR